MFVYQLTDIRKTLDDYSNYENIDLAYVVLKNKQLIDKKLMELDFIKNVSNEIVEYENKRVDICVELSEKDESGNPLIQNETYVIKEESKEEFNNRLITLYKEYENAISERQNQINLFNQKMNTEIDFEFYKLTKEQIPQQIKTANDLEKIYFMID